MLHCCDLLSRKTQTFKEETNRTCQRAAVLDVDSDSGAPRGPAYPHI